MCGWLLSSKVNFLGGIKFQKQDEFYIFKSTKLKQALQYMPRARTILNDYGIVVEKSKNEQTTKKTQIATPIFFAILRPLAPFQARPQSMHLFRLNLLGNESHMSIWRSHFEYQTENQIGQLRQSIPLQQDQNNTLLKNNLSFLIRNRVIQLYLK